MILFFYFGYEKHIYKLFIIFYAEIFHTDCVNVSATPAMKHLQQNHFAYTSKK
jgi:hypothetical protein